MKVILLQDVKKQGKKDQIINVSDGYAQNYLIKLGLAVPCNESNKNKLDKELKNREIAKENLIKECEALKVKLDKVVVKFTAKTSKDGRMFGSISTKQVVDELNKLGYEVKKTQVKCDHPMDCLGMHDVEIQLHKKVIAKIKVSIS